MDRSGFKRIETGPSRPCYGDFFPIADIADRQHRNRLQRDQGDRDAQAGAGEAVDLWLDFAVAHRIQRYRDTTIRSEIERRRVAASEIPE